ALGGLLLERHEMDDRVDAAALYPGENLLGIGEQRLHGGKTPHLSRHGAAAEEPDVARVAGHERCAELAAAHHLREHRFLLAEGRRRIDALDFDRQLVADEDFAPGDEPGDVGRLDAALVEQKAARPRHRGRAVAETADLLAFEVARVFQSAFAVKDIPLARPALKENGKRDERLPLLARAQKSRG